MMNKKPTYKNGNVAAQCLGCGVFSSFENQSMGKGFGSVEIKDGHQYNGGHFNRILYVLLRCASCGAGGLAKVHANESVVSGVLESFHPIVANNAKLPESTPEPIKKEFREAEGCLGHGFCRAASALFRSVLEKVLIDHGYTAGKLVHKIDAAFVDGILTDVRKNKANEDIRSLGNDILHDEYREVSPAEVEVCHHYTQRILEDFYDDQETVRKILESKGKKQVLKVM